MFRRLVALLGAVIILLSLPLSPAQAENTDYARKLNALVKISTLDKHEGYARAEFPHWRVNAPQNKYQADFVVQARDLSEVVMRSGGRPGEVESGTLAPDPYTGQRLTWKKTNGAKNLSIDHIVPLSRAWDLGAHG